ncbi:hypothetical protein RHECIAT_CH0003752 [Rhizobium etli CIAT 652]|uniref:Uncharacterized protein n=1 Tax=Rhizobium etli (strain CIAT 652) TaxID=491916 RepID=B3PZ26_RHIE6|nr:hypothetical protein RHECIAT_CH0003752 [Rhizobium etli CIAT 652]
MTPAASAARHASCIQWKPCRWTLSRGMSLAHRKSAPTWRIMLCEIDDDFRGRCVGQLNLIKVVETLAILI